MTKQETYDYLRARGAAFEITEHKAVYNLSLIHISEPTRR